MSVNASLISCSVARLYETTEQLSNVGVWEDKRIEGELPLCPGNTEQRSSVESRPKRHSKRPVWLTRNSRRWTADVSNRSKLRHLATTSAGAQQHNQLAPEEAEKG